MLEYAIFDAILRIARPEHGVVDDRIQCRIDIAGFVFVHCLRDVDRVHHKLRGVAGRRADDDRIVILRILLRFRPCRPPVEQPTQ